MFSFIKENWLKNCPLDYKIILWEVSLGQILLIVQFFNQAKKAKMDLDAKKKYEKMSKIIIMIRQRLIDQTSTIAIGAMESCCCL